MNSPLSYAQIASAYDANRPTMDQYGLSVNDFAELGNYFTRSNNYDAGTGNAFTNAAKRFAYEKNKWINENLAPVVDFTGNISEELFRFFGADTATGRQVGEGLVSQGVDFLPAVAGYALSPWTSGASIPIGNALTSAMSGATALESSDSYGQAGIMAALPWVAPGVSGLGAQAAVKGVAAPLSRTAVGKALGFAGGAQVGERMVAKSIADRLTAFAGSEAAIVSAVEAAQVGVSALEGEAYNPFAKENLLANALETAIMPFSYAELIHPADLGPVKQVQRQVEQERSVVMADAEQGLERLRQLKPAETFGASLTASYLSAVEESNSILDPTQRSAARQAVEARYQNLREQSDPTGSQPEHLFREDIRKVMGEVENEGTAVVDDAKVEIDPAQTPVWTENPKDGKVRYLKGGETKVGDNGWEFVGLGNGYESREKYYAEDGYYMKDILKTDSEGRQRMVKRSLIDDVTQTEFSHDLETGLYSVEGPREGEFRAADGSVDQVKAQAGMRRVLMNKLDAKVEALKAKPEPRNLKEMQETVLAVNKVREENNFEPIDDAELAEGIEDQLKDGAAPDEAVRRTVRAKKEQTVEKVKRGPGRPKKEAFSGETEQEAAVELAKLSEGLLEKSKTVQMYAKIANQGLELTSKAEESRLANNTLRDTHKFVRAAKRTQALAGDLQKLEALRAEFATKSGKLNKVKVEAAGYVWHDGDFALKNSQVFEAWKLRKASYRNIERMAKKEVPTEALTAPDGTKSFKTQEEAEQFADKHVDKGAFVKTMKGTKRVDGTYPATRWQVVVPKRDTKVDLENYSAEAVELTNQVFAKDAVRIDEVDAKQADAAMLEALEEKIKIANKELEGFNEKLFRKLMEVDPEAAYDALAEKLTALDSAFVDFGEQWPKGVKPLVSERPRGDEGLTKVLADVLGVTEDGKLTLTDAKNAIKGETVDEALLVKWLESKHLGRKTWEAYKRARPDLVEDGKVSVRSLRDVAEGPLVQVEVHGENREASDKAFREFAELRHEFDTLGFDAPKLIRAYQRYERAKEVFGYNDAAARARAFEDYPEAALDLQKVFDSPELLVKLRRYDELARSFEDDDYFHEGDFAQRYGSVAPDNFEPFDPATGLGNVAYELRVPGVKGGGQHTGNDDTLAWVRGKFVEQYDRRLKAEFEVIADSLGFQTDGDNSTIIARKLVENRMPVSPNHKITPELRTKAQQLINSAKKVFRIDEVQSDAAQEWHSRLKTRLEQDIAQWKDTRSGWTSGPDIPAIRREVQLLDEKIADAEQRLKQNGHPFFSSYESMALRVAIQRARENGADEVFLPDGETAMMSEGHDKTNRYLHIDTIKLQLDEADGPYRLSRAFSRIHPELSRGVPYEEIRGLGLKAPTTTIGNRKYIYSKVDQTVKVYDLSQPEQSKGMHDAYDRRLPQTAAKLLGDKGTPTTLGVHKNGPSPVFKETAENKPLSGALVAVQSRVGEGKTSVTGLSFPLGKTADFPVPDLYHGTPHEILESFDLQKVGSGEGAQVYGWGLYFTEKLGIAEHYKEGLSQNVWYYDGKPFDPSDLRMRASAHLNRTFIGMRNSAIQALEKDLAFLERHHSQLDTQERLRKEIDILKNKQEAKAEKVEGNVYTVRLDADTDEFLHWDLPLAQQPQKVREALENFFEHKKAIYDISQAKGSDLYTWLAQEADSEVTAMSKEGLLGNTLVKHLGSPRRKASEKLLELGIKGVRYLDGVSRPKGEGSYNYVVFDDSSITVIAKNGQPFSASRSSSTRHVPIATLQQLGRSILIQKGFTAEQADATMPFFDAVAKTFNLDDVRFGQLVEEASRGKATIDGNVRMLLLSGRGLNNLSPADQLRALSFVTGHEIGHLVEHLYRRSMLNERQMKAFKEFVEWTTKADEGEKKAVFELMRDGMLPAEFREYEIIGHALANLNKPEELRANLVSMWTMAQAARQVEDARFAHTLLPKPVRAFVRMLTDFARRVYGAVRGAFYKLPKEGSTIARQRVYALKRMLSDLQDAQFKADTLMTEFEGIGMVGPNVRGSFNLRAQDLQGQSKILDDFLVPFSEEETSVLPGKRSKIARGFERVVLQGDQLAALLPELKPVFSALHGYAANIKAMTKRAVGKMTGDVDDAGNPYWTKAGHMAWEKVTKNRRNNKLLSAWMRAQQDIDNPVEGPDGQLVQAKGMFLDYEALAVHKPSLRRELDTLKQSDREAVIEMHKRLTDSMFQLQGDVLKHFEQSVVVSTQAYLALRQPEKHADVPGIALAMFKAMQLAKNPETRFESDLLLQQAATAVDNDAIFLGAMDIARRGFAGWNDLALFFGQRKWFFSEIRTGEFLIKWTENDGTTGSQGFDSRADAQFYEKQLRARGVKNIALVRSERGQAHFDVEPEWMQKAKEFEEANKAAIDAMADLTDAQRELLKSQHDYMAEFTRAFAAHTVFKAGSQRKHAAGREDLDMVNTHIAYINAAARASNRQVLQHALLYAYANPKLKDPKNYDLVEQSKRMVQNFMSPDTRFGTEVTAFNASYFLGLNISSHIAELMQPIFTYVPEMLNRGFSLFESHRMIARAQAETAKFFASHLPKKAARKFGWDQTSSRDDNSKWGDADITDLMNWSATRGLISLTHASDLIEADVNSTVDLTGLAHKGTKVDFAKLLWSPVKAFSRTTLKLYQQFTEFNARVSLITGYRMARKKGMDHVAAREYAAEYSHQVTFSGGKANRPELLFGGEGVYRTGGQMAYSLQGYTFGMLSMMYRYAQTAFNAKQFPDLTPEQRKNARKALTTLVTTQFAGAGLLGMPFIGAAMALLEEYTDAEPFMDTRLWLAKLFQEDEEAGGLLTDIVMYGAANAFANQMLPGAPDVQSRFALGIVMGTNPYTGFSLDQLAGPTGSIVRNFGAGLSALATEGSFERAVGEWAPVSMKKFLELSRNDGRLADAQGNTLIEARPEEQFLYAIGFTPQRLRKLKDTTRMGERHQEVNRRKESRFNDEGAELFFKDPRAAAAMIRRRALEDELFDAQGSIRKIAERVENKVFERDLRRDGSAVNTRNYDALLRSMNVTAQASELQRMNLREQVVAQLGGQPTRSRHAYMRAQMIDQIMQRSPFMPRSQAAAMVDAQLSGRR